MPGTPIPVLADPQDIEREFDRLTFASFSHDDAVRLGEDLVRRARDKGWAVAISVTLKDHEVFHVALPGTTEVNDQWIARKRRLVEHTSLPSFLVGQRLARDGQTLDDMGLDEASFAAHGGGYPLMVGSEMVGSVIVSGVPQQDDHALVVEGLTALAL